MNPSAHDIRFLVETCRRNDMAAAEAHHFISKAWGPTATTLQTVHRLYREFASGSRDSFEDKDRSGRPCSSNHAEITALIRELLEEDPHATIEDLMECTGASYGMIQRILTQELQLKWITAKWVPHFLTAEQKANRVREATAILKFIRFNRRTLAKRLVIIDEKWIYHRTVGTKSSNKIWARPDSDQPRVVKRIQHEKKSMVTVAISFDGKACTDILPFGETVNAHYYQQFLRKVVHNFSLHADPLLPCDMVLLHDNARPHTTTSVQSWLEKKASRC